MSGHGDTPAQVASQGSSSISRPERARCAGKAGASESGGANSAAVMSVRPHDEAAVDADVRPGGIRGRVAGEMATASPISSGSPARCPSAMLRRTPRLASGVLKSGEVSLMALATQPGPMWLTVMASRAHSRAITPTRCPTACFVPPYTAICANGICACTDDVTMIRPPSPCARNCAAAARQVLKQPSRLTPTSRSHRSALMSATVCQSQTPALATTTSRRPMRSTVCAISASAAAGSLTSAGIRAARLPSASISPTRRSPSAVTVRSLITTSAP